MNLRIFISSIAAFLLLFSGLFGFAEAMSSTNYEIRFDSLHFGATDTASSASYQLHSSVGASATDRSTSSSYTLSTGYREGIYDPVADFDVYVQNYSSQTAATSLSSNTVTVASASGYSVGEMIALVANEGSSQVAAIGKISSISGSDITVDFWTNAGSAPTIDGSSDYVYRLTGSSMSLGSLTDSAVTTGIIAWEVNADVDDGYSVYVEEDQDLQDSSGDYTIPDVADGSVSPGSSEYGGKSSDSSLSLSTFDTADTAFTSSMQQIASRSDNALKARDFLTVKIAVSSTQNETSYSSSLTLTYVGDY